MSAQPFLSLLVDVVGNIIKLYLTGALEDAEGSLRAPRGLPKIWDALYLIN